MSNRYLMKYKGTYRLLPILDLETNDFPRQPDGNIEEDCEIYINCYNGCKIYAYGTDGHKEMQLGAYIPSIGRGRNIKKAMNKQNIPYYNYDESDEEVMFLFSSNDIKEVANLMKAKTSGASISPFSTKNLPKEKVDIPEEELAKYKSATSKVGKSDMLVIKTINKSFENEILAKKLRPPKTRKMFDVRGDMKIMKLSRDFKGYVYKKGFWQEYIEFLEKNIDEYINNKNNS